MPTKSDLLKKLTSDQLEEIAITEGIKIPERARKPEIIRRLLKISMSSIREYVSEYVEEEIDRTTVVQEKIKRKRARVGTREKVTSEIKLERDKIISNLVRNKIRLFSAVIKDIGERYRFHPKLSGRLFDIYDAFNDSGLDMVYRCFVEKEIDPRGKFLEYRFAQWLARRHKGIVDMDIAKKISPVGEIDAIGYDENNQFIVVAECKARRGKAKKEDLDKWIENIKLIKQTNDSLKTAYFVNTSGYTQETLNRLLERNDVTSDGKLKTSLLGRVKLGLCEEREGKIKQVRFPKR